MAATIQNISLVCIYFTQDYNNRSFNSVIQSVVTNNWCDIQIMNTCFLPILLYFCQQLGAESVWGLFRLSYRFPIAQADTPVPHLLFLNYSEIYRFYIVHYFGQGLQKTKLIVETHRTNCFMVTLMNVLHNNTVNRLVVWPQYKGYKILLDK